MLKQYLDSKNLTVYQVAKGSGLPYTTLNELVLGKKDPNVCSVKTYIALAAFFNTSIDEIYRIINDKDKKIANNYLDSRFKQYEFPIIVKSNINLKRIHPLKQRIVNNIYESLKDNKQIEEVYIFGSSTTIRCNKNSDIDIAIRLINDTKENKEVISDVINNICNYNCDIIWLNSIEKETKLYKNVERGLRIL